MPIPGYPNYEASNLGRIRSVFIHVLKPKLNYRTLKREPEYELVVIRGRRVMVHRLVAAAFHGPRPDGNIVHHRDNKKRNNMPENLEYVTPSQNTKMAYADGRIGRTFKLTAFARKKLVEMYETGRYTTAMLAKQFGVSSAHVQGLLAKSGVTGHGKQKIPPAIREEIRGKWVPWKYPQSRLAEEYGVSLGCIEVIMREGRGHSDETCA